MAYFATKKYSYTGQLIILMCLCGGGLIIGSILSLLPFLQFIQLSNIKGLNIESLIAQVFKPENANVIRLAQFISTLFIFFVPAYLYAWVCHKKPNIHLGFIIKPNLSQTVLFIGIMLASLPLVSALQQVTEMLPWSKAQLAVFKAAEDAYNKQVAVIARMDNVWDYIISVIVIAFLPALFEETMFRGGLQNLVSRWTKKPILSIVITAIVFSAIHGSYLGFLSRFALGFILGWVYYKTGNIWLNIIGHFINNGLAVTVLYFSATPGSKVNPAAIEDHYPVWTGLVSIAIVIVLCKVFDTVTKKYIDNPGQEVLIPGYNFSNHPFDNDIA